jgi:NADPH-dependent curcumin reductase CurA
VLPKSKESIQIALILTGVFVVCRFDYADRYPEALADLGKWIAEGRIVQKYHIVQGLEKAPEALPLLYTGGNTGKLFVPPSFQPQFLVLT